MNPALRHALERLGRAADLSADEAHAAFAAVMAGDAPEAAVAALLTALRIKGETAEELAGAVAAVREQMTPWEPSNPLCRLLDTCGTGGDGANTVNVSTAAAVVAAACGVPVAKHGNRSATGNSGSAEVLTELGIAVDAEPDTLRRCLIELNITFLFAPRFHPALRVLAPVRRLLPFRTVFNLIGPLANPAQPDFQLIGVPGDRQAGLVAQALTRLGARRAAVVTGSDGLDEVTLAGPTHVLLVESGRLTGILWNPDDFGLPEVHSADLRVSGPAESAGRLRELFAGGDGPVRALVLANSAAALWVAGRVVDLREGVALAARALDSGAAAGLVERWGRFSRGEG